ncbi:MAG: extracellular solute-binding protein [Candidatus Dojkabacteria bacterium]|nr:extracellular solute-binding protein [Candidatus Dojkabacteria bacterium]
MAEYSSEQQYTYENLYDDTTNSIQQETEKDSKKSRIFILVIIATGIALALFLIILLFSGINLQNNNELTENDNDPIKLTGSILWRGVFIDKTIADTLINEYKKTRPNVTVIYDNVWNNSKNQKDQIIDYQNELNRILSSNNPLQIPDIFMIKNTWVGDYESRIVPHPTETKQSLLSKNYYNFVADDFAQNNVVYGKPLWVDTFAIVYNKDLLLQNSNVSIVPNNLENFLNFVKNFDTSNSFAFGMGTTFNVSFAFEFFQILLMNEGINFESNEAKLLTNFDYQKFRNAFIFFKSFLPKWSINQKNDSLAFLEGKLTMIFIPSYRLRNILLFNDIRNLNLNIEISEVPYVNKKYNVADYWGLVVSRTSTNSKIAWDFIDWLSENSNLELLHNLVKEKAGYFGTITPKKNINEKIKQNDKFLNIYINELDHVKTWYQIKGTQIQIEFEKILRQQSITREEILTLNNEIRRLQQQKGIFSQINIE